MKVKVKEPEEEKEELEEEAEEEEAEAEESEPAAETTDNVGDPSVEINVEELIHELEVDGVVQPGKEQAAKRRLELLMEEKRAKRDLEDFDDYDV
jgi:phage antirepressor YoqD-like protein